MRIKNNQFDIILGYSFMEKSECVKTIYRNHHMKMKTNDNEIQCRKTPISGTSIEHIKQALVKPNGQSFPNRSKASQRKFQPLHHANNDLAVDSQRQNKTQTSEEEVLDNLNNLRIYHWSPDKYDHCRRR